MFTFFQFNHTVFNKSGVNILDVLRHRQEYYNTYIPKQYHFSQFTLNHLEPFLLKNHQEAPQPPWKLYPKEEQFFCFDNAPEYELI